MAFEVSVLISPFLLAGAVAITWRIEKRYEIICLTRTRHGQRKRDEISKISKPDLTQPNPTQPTHHSHASDSNPSSSSLKSQPSTVNSQFPVPESTVRTTLAAVVDSPRVPFWDPGVRYRYFVPSSRFLWIPNSALAFIGRQALEASPNLA